MLEVVYHVIRGGTTPIQTCCGCYVRTLLNSELRMSVKAKGFRLRIRSNCKDCQQSSCVLNYLESLTIQKVIIRPLMSQVNKTSDDSAPFPG